MKRSIIAVDIGNTSILAGRISGGKLGKVCRVPTGLARRKALAAFKKAFLPRRAEAFVIASVVPAVGRFLRREIPTAFRVPAYLIGRDLQAPIVNRYRTPGQVGIDRLMNAVAAFCRYGRPAIVIDFGTAITFDVVSGKGEYLGGVIAPGIEISLEALFQKTALLPRIRMARPKGVMGRDTVESIRAGCAYGIGGLCERVIDEIKKHYQFKPLIIATGGYARFMRNYCRGIDKIDDGLTLQGIYQTYLSYITK
ncbi:MAG: type III pantothenate kinase [Candidatus Omnitrophota bacterium]